MYHSVTFHHDQKGNKSLGSSASTLRPEIYIFFCNLVIASDSMLLEAARVFVIECCSKHLTFCVFSTAMIMIEPNTKQAKDRQQTKQKYWENCTGVVRKVNEYFKLYKYSLSSGKEAVYCMLDKPVQATEQQSQKEGSWKAACLIVIDRCSSNECKKWKSSVREGHLNMCQCVNW